MTPINAPNTTLDALLARLGVDALRNADLWGARISGERSSRAQTSETRCEPNGSRRRDEPDER